MRKTIQFCILLFTFCVLFTACRKKCEHTYDNNCDSTCNVCEEAREIGDHQWKDATCTSPRSCTVCGSTQGSALAHDWNNATCISAKTCKTCSLSEGAALGHTPAEDDGDCTTDVKCATCGAVTTPARLEHMPHADDGDCTTPITCTECNTVLTAANSHDFTGDYESDEAQHWHVCKNEGCTVTDEKVEHTPNQDEATTSAPKQCTVCEYVIEPQLPHEHSYTVADHNDTHHYMRCDCGEIDESTKVAHSATADNDCTTADLCSCGYTVTAANESHTSAEDDGDCRTELKCVHCDYVFLAAKEHNYSDELSSITTHHFYSCMNDGCDLYIGEEEHHGEDDGDCTTRILCECGWLVTEANESHTPSEDDGDCTTAVHCVNCDRIATPAKETHVATRNPATCLSLGTCDECGTNLPGYDVNVHVSENYTYTDNGDGTYQKVHECGVTVEEAHTFNSACPCGDKIVITHMTISDGGFTYDPTTNTYALTSTKDLDIYYYVFHGINLKYYTPQNTIQMIKIGDRAWGFSSYNVSYDESADTLSILGAWEKSEDFAVSYSNDSGITWEEGCFISIRRLLAISTDDYNHGSVTANEYAIEGELVTLNIAPDEGYKLKSLTVKDSANNEVTVENGSFTMPESPVSVSATFVCEDECAFTYIPNHDLKTHKLVCPNCDFVEIESEAHHELEYYYVDNGDHTHTKIWKCCNESIILEHHFYMDQPCACGSAAIGITGIIFIANEEYIYDTETRTYTVIIPPDRDTAAVTIRFVGSNLEYTSVENVNIRVIEVHKYGEDEYSLYDLIYNLNFEFEWTDMEDGSFLEYMFTNDSGENWTKYRIEVKQSYSISANEAEGGTVTVGEGKTHALAGDTVTLSATPDTGYIFDSWAVTDADGNPVTVENGRFIMPASEVTVNAIFKVGD